MRELDLKVGGYVFMDEELKRFFYIPENTTTTLHEKMASGI